MAWSSWHSYNNPTSSSSSAAAGPAPCAKASPSDRAGAQGAPCAVSQSAPEKRTRGERGGHNRPSKASYLAYTRHGIWIKREPMEGHIAPAFRTQKVSKEVVDKIQGCQY